MRKARWLANGQNSTSKPVIYHCISRVVDRRFVFAERECEAFRMFMRMYENFSGCRVLSYCVMSNHFHLLLEVPPMVEGGAFRRGAAATPFLPLFRGVCGGSCGGTGRG